MTLPTWPSLLPQRPLRQGYRVEPYQAPLRSEMELGARYRREVSRTPWRLSLGYRLSQAALPVFRAWWHHRLADGTAWYQASLFSGATYETVEARPIGGYQLEARRLAAWTATLQLEVAAFAPVDVTGLTAAWPSGLPPAPDGAGYRVTAHEDTLRTQDQTGPAATRQRFAATPGTVEATWTLTFAQFVLFRAWWDQVLLQGCRWADVPLWLDGAVAARAVRFNGPWRAELSGALRWRVTARLETAPLPLLGADALSGIID